MLRISRGCSLENFGVNQHIVYMLVGVQYRFKVLICLVPGLPVGLLEVGLLEVGLLEVRLPSPLTALRIMGVFAYPHGLHRWP